MNLEYAAYLLNENYLLAEDADSDGIKYAKKWVTKNFNLTDFGQNATDPVLDDEGNPVVVNQQTQDDQGNPTTVQRNVPNVEDIVENPLNIQFEELAPEQLVAALPDVDVAVINGNYAIEAGLVVGEDAVAVEDVESEAAGGQRAQ